MTEILLQCANLNHLLVLNLTQDFYVCPWGNKSYEKTKVQKNILSFIIPILSSNTQLIEFTCEIK